MIVSVSREQWNEVMELWEASVRATHGFLSEADLQFYKKVIPECYLPEISLYCVRNEAGVMLGFLGASDDAIEMLFVRPEARGRRVGSELVRFGLGTLGLTKVDVNEQNPQALGFYLRMGFRVVRRTPTDGTGRAYPILEMERDSTS